MKNIFLITIWSLNFGMLSAQLSKYWQQHIDYKMDIEVNVKDFTYTGNQEIIYKNNSPDTLRKVYFHLYWNAFQPKSMMAQRINNVLEKGDGRLKKNIGTKEEPKWVSELAQLKPEDYGRQTILSLKQNGMRLKYKVEGTILEVDLAEPVLPDSDAKFEMRWEAKIPKIVRRAGKNNDEGVDLSMTQWYPKMVEYDYDGWHADEYIGREFFGVFGNFDVSITIDPSYIVGAGGEIQNPEEVNGYGGHPIEKQTYHFIAKNIHDFAWVADPDFVVEVQYPKEGPKTYYVYQKKINGAYWEDVKPYMEKYWAFMNHYFGKYQYPTYSILQGGDGGMEYGACTLVRGKHKTVENFANLLFHEVGHSWFQQMLGTDENTSAWMDEGMTSYVEDLTLHKIFNKAGNPFATAYDNYRFLQRSGEETQPVTTLSDHFNTGVGYSLAAYIKSEVFIAQLGYIIGEENLRTVFRQYFNYWKLKHPNMRDFKHIAQKVSGMNLRWYFNQFLRTTAAIDYKIKEVKAVGEHTQITLENIGGIAMPIDFYVLPKAGEASIYYIPLKLLREEKPNDFHDLSRTTLPDWGWTQKTYTFIINQPLSELKTLMIDASGRLADINLDNNVYQVK